MSSFVLMPAFIIGASVVLSGCGGRGSTSGGAMPSIINAIAAQSVPTPLWTMAGNPPACVDGVFINSSIIFSFSAEVDPYTLPAPGAAIGSITIVDHTPGSPAFGHAAVGTFAVVDDPALPAANHRRVMFAPLLPGDPNVGCAAGLNAGSEYQISVPRGGTSSQVLRVGGQPIQNDVTTCFRTCGCPDPNPCVSSFVDALPGAPYVVSTTPACGNPSPPPIDPGSIAGNTISIVVSEALKPGGINLANVKVVNTATNAQVPGTLVFHQAGTIPGLPVDSRIDYVASSPLSGGVTYQILFAPGVTDLGGNRIEPVPGNPSALLLFQTIPVYCPQPPIVETFDTTASRDVVTGSFDWSGNGLLQATLPLILTGTGSDGAFNPAASTLTILDTNQLVGGQSRMGFFDFTDVNIPANAYVRISGPYPAHIRCTGTFTSLGTIDVSAGQLLSNSANVWDRGPEQGFINNNNGTHCYALGGQTSAGGGPGGTGSGVTPPAGSPPTFGCLLRTFNGEAGYGPFIGGVLNTGIPSNIQYAGGPGGQSACFPFTAPTPGCALGDIGGLGGAGGSAGRVGEDGLPRQISVACTPVSPQPSGVAIHSPVPAAMVPPIGVPSAGSGGGGGGDHLDAIPTVPANDDEGGGGGGGGGGLRISCVGAFSMGNATTPGTIKSEGARGATGASGFFAGAGGSGSGGEVWIQSFSTVTITSNSVIDVLGPSRLLPTAGNIGCSIQASGGGGDGLVQIEAGQGPIPAPSFNLVPTPSSTSGAVFSAPPFQFAGTIVGQARSSFRYTGYGAPVYTGVTEQFDVGNAAGATLTIRYEGAHEAVNSTPQTPVFDPATIKSMASGGGPITAANISELDGHAFIRFVVNMSYPSPPATPPNAILPSVDAITINYSAPINCP